MVCVPEVQLGGDGGTNEGFEVGAHEGERVFVLDSDVVELPVTMHSLRSPFFFLTKKKPAATGDV